MGEEEDGDESGSPAPCRRRQSQQRAPVGLIGEQVWLRQSLGGKTLRPREPGRGPGDSQMERQLLPGASRAEPASCRGLSPGLPPAPPQAWARLSAEWRGHLPLRGPALPLLCSPHQVLPGRRGAREQRVCGMSWPVSSASLSPTCLSSRCSALLDPRGPDPPDSGCTAGLLSAACSRRCLLSNYYMRVLGARRANQPSELGTDVLEPRSLILLMAGVRRNPRPEPTAGAAQPSRLLRFPHRPRRGREQA